MKMKTGKLIMLFIMGIVAAQAGAELLSITPPTDGVGLNPFYPTWRLYETVYTGYYWGDIRTYIKFDLTPLAALAAQAVQDGQTLQINSVTFGAFSASLTNNNHSFSDALYAVADTAWTETTLPDGYLPALGNILGTWNYVEWDWNTMSSDSLKSLVQEKASGVNKQIAFCMAASVLDDYANDRHAYYFNSTNMKLDIDYTIPEPTTIAFMGFGLVGLLRRKHRA